MPPAHAEPTPPPSSHAIEPRRAAGLARAVADWFAANARDLPWRTSPRDPQRRESAEAVCGLATAGVFCTGFLASDRSHLLTANHCIPGVAAARNTNLWFRFETDCNGTTYFGTTVVPGPQQFLAGDPAADWTLLRSNTNPAATFGFLSL
ncbi:MAG: trypsin-like serine protease, partial [Phycisphaerales bacterium JB040]